MQFLSIFRTTYWLRVLKTFEKENFRCPSGFVGDKWNLFRKMPQIRLEIDENPKRRKKFSNVIMQILSNFRETW